jgi:tRNA threonylcarbamoyladenosine biosynthesis protein TsaE
VLNKIYNAHNEEETIALAATISDSLQKQDIIALYGDLGSGKSFLARHIIQNFIGSDKIVNSPTFNLLQIYEQGTNLIYHYDLYRLKDLVEIYELDIEAAFDNAITIIEWPNIIEPILPLNIINIKIEYVSNYFRKFLIQDNR